MYRLWLDMDLHVIDENKHLECQKTLSENSNPTYLSVAVSGLLDSLIVLLSILLAHHGRDIVKHLHHIRLIRPPRSPVPVKDVRGMNDLLPESRKFVFGDIGKIVVGTSELDPSLGVVVAPINTADQKSIEGLAGPEASCDGILNLRGLERTAVGWIV